MMVDQYTLVLNQNYEPLNVCKLKRAIVLVLKGKAEIVEKNDSSLLKTVNKTFEVPSVIRLYYFVNRPKKNVHLSRKMILLRDNFTCQYCGKKTNELTIDHVIPKKYGGKATWENLVASCKICNNKKADKTLEEANMRLIRRPRPLKYLPAFGHSKYFRYIENEAWRKYIT